MNVDHEEKYLQSIDIRKAAATATTSTASVNATNFKVGRRRISISREVSNMSNSSIEAAGGGGEYHAQELAAVPFVWESSPGTPKRHITKKSSNHKFEYIIPPLTPPPSYEYRNHKIRSVCSSTKKKKQNDANVNLIQSIFPRLSLKRDHSPYPSLSSSSTTTSSSSPPTTSSSSSSPSSQSFEYSSAMEEEEEAAAGGRSGGSPVSTLCFSRRLSCCNGKFRGLYLNWF